MSSDSLDAHGALLIRDRRVHGGDVAVDKVARELHAIREWGTGAVGSERQPGLRGGGVGPRRGPGQVRSLRPTGIHQAARARSTQGKRSADAMPHGSLLDGGQAVRSADTTRCTEQGSQQLLRAVGWRGRRAGACSHGECAELREGADVQRLHQRAAGRKAVLARAGAPGAGAGAGLHDRPPDEALAEGGRGDGADGEPARGLPEQRDRGRVAAEAPYVARPATDPCPSLAKCVCAGIRQWARAGLTPTAAPR